MWKNIRSILLLFLFGSICIMLVWFAIAGVREIGRTLLRLNPELAVALIMGAATVIAATITVMLGRYLERKREIEAHFRADKIKIYDEFLKEFFKVFHSPEQHASDELVKFLREWQRRLVIWGGDQVLRTYFSWMNRMKSGIPDANSILLMDDFFRALRADIGQRSSALRRGAFAHLVLRHGDFFLAQARKNPSMTLTELAELEKREFGDGK